MSRRRRARLGQRRWRYDGRCDRLAGRVPAYLTVEPGAIVLLTSAQARHLLRRARRHTYPLPPSE